MITSPHYSIAIESSCDDTSVSVLKDRRVLSNVTANQAVHEQFGGVVPELASRAHQKNIIPVATAALDQAGIALNQLNSVAYTRGPGLLGSLLVGTSFAKSIALALKIPLIEVNHMEAHVLAHFVDDGTEELIFPFLCLTVSGGHTQIVMAESPTQLKVLGETIDDAAGEAFDKVAKIMGLPYPGGPFVDQLAASGNPHAFRFPPTSMDNLQFSFSGIKTSFLYLVRDKIEDDPDFIEKHKNDLCASFQYVVVNSLMNNLEKAAKQFGITRIALAGGVSANKGLRQEFEKRCEINQWEGRVPAFEYCTDNAAMIGVAGYYLALEGKFASYETPALARLKIGD